MEFINIETYTTNQTDDENNAIETDKPNEINENIKANEEIESDNPSYAQKKPLDKIALRAQIEEAILNASIAIPSEFEMTPHEANLLNIELTVGTRKRATRLVGMGYTVRDAKELSQIPGAVNFAPTLMKTKQELRTSVNIAVMPPTYPCEIWSKRQLMAIKQCIQSEIQVQPDDKGPFPSFYGCWLEGGWIKFGCCDKQTANWLYNRIPKLKPWDGAQLWAVDELRARKFEIYEGYFPGAANFSDAYIASYIEGHNKSLSTEMWQLIRRERRGNDAKLTFAVDVLSVRKIKLLNHKIIYGLATITLRPKFVEQKVAMLLEKVVLNVKKYLDPKEKVTKALRVKGTIGSRSHRRVVEWKEKIKEKRQRRKEERKQRRLEARMAAAKEKNEREQNEAASEETQHREEAAN